MKKTNTLKHFRSCLYIALMVLFVQLSMAQDSDFETNELDMAVMEAENYSDLIPNGESTWIDEDELPDDFSGDGYIKAIQPGEKVERVDDAIASTGYVGYNINFKNAATYYIWLRGSRTGGDDDSFHVVLADTEGNVLDKVDMIAWEGELVPTDNKNNWVWVYYSSFAETEGAAFIDIATAGIYQFRIYVREGNTKLDKILLTSDSEYVPESESTGPEETLPTSIFNSKNFKNNVLSTFPNPVTDKLNIQIKNANYSNGIINIVNLQGKLVEKIVLDNQLSLNADLSHLASGIYLIKFEQNNTLIAIDKLLKQ